MNRFTASPSEWTARYRWILIPLALLGVVFAVTEALRKFILVPPSSHLDQLLLFRGLVIFAVLSSLAVWWLLQQSIPKETSSQAHPSDLPTPLSDETWTRRCVSWLIRLRWLVCASMIPMVIMLNRWQGASPSTPDVGLLLGCIILLAAANATFALAFQANLSLGNHLIAHIMIDLVLLTMILHFAGAVDTPFAALYTLHIVLANIILSRRVAAAVSTVAVSLFLLLVLSEVTGLSTHRSLNPASDMLDIVATPTGHSLAEWSIHTIGILAVLGGSAYLGAVAASQLHSHRRATSKAMRTAVTEREKLERGLDAAGAGLLLVDEKGEVIWSSRRVSGTFHAPNARACGRCPQCTARRALQEGRAVSTEFTTTEENGPLRYYRATASPLKASDSDLGHIVEVIQDVTEAKQLEDEIVRAGKLAAVGRLSAVVVHEVGNPLASMRARLTLIERTEDPSFARASMPILRQQLDRIQRIVHGLSGFARTHGDEVVVCDVNEIVCEVIEFLKLDPKTRDRSFELDLSRDEPHAAWIRDELVQVVLNLTINAIRAAGSGGSVQLTTREAGSSIEIEVTDSGPGVRADLLEQIFDPFFTTDEAGLGLGLTISRSILRKRGGELVYRAGRPGGACFVVTLPNATARKEELRST